MGAGISIASNTAAAVASAYTNVVNNTNVTQDQKVVQSQSVTLENCDITAEKDIDMKVTSQMRQSMTQIANVTNDTSIANAVSQALAQAATSSVGVGVIGIADSNNTASTYANMTTNVSNYVKFSSRQSSQANQSFTCQNSTIISKKGGFNLSMQEMGDVSQYQKDSVMNQTHVTNTITQTIKQTATASTGMSWWVLLALAVLAVVAFIVFKLKDAKSKASRAIDMQQAMELGCCTKIELNISTIRAGGVKSTMSSIGMGINKGLNATVNQLNKIGTSSGTPQQSAACVGCDCYKLAHPEAHISRATFVIYLIGIAVLGGLIGIWYAMAIGRGCLSDDACGANLGSNFNGMMAGCSCEFNQTGDGDIVCKDALPATVNGNGLPLKYQYNLFVQGTAGQGGCASAKSYSSSSMQGILVQALATITNNSNSNSGKNMDTIDQYMNQLQAPSQTPGNLSNYLGSSDNNQALSSLYNIYSAAVKYIKTQSGGGFDILNKVIDSQSDDQQVYQLYAFMCPLRPLLFDSSYNPIVCTWPKVPYQQGSPADNPFSSSNLAFPIVDGTTHTTSNTYAVYVPPAFRYGDENGGNASGNQGANAMAGCCSLHTMKYVKTGGTAFSCGCGNDTDENSAVSF